MHMIDAVLLLIAPEKFIARASKHAISREFQRNKQLKVEFPDEVLPPERRLNFERNVRSQARVFRRSIFSSVGITLSAIFVGVAFGALLRNAVGSPSKLAVYGFQALGASIILGATLAEVGRKIETWSKESMSEELNAFMFRALYVFGTFLFVVSVAWDAT